MRVWICGILWVSAGLVIGVLGSRLTSPSPAVSAPAPKAPGLLTDRSPTPAPDPLLSFRELLFRQIGRPTVEASLQLHQHLARASSAELAEALRELDAGHDAVFDPLLRCLAFVLKEHLRTKAPDRLAEFADPDGSERGEDRRESLLREIAQRDPAWAFTIAQNEPFAMLRPGMMEAALQGTAESNPEIAFRLWDSVIVPDLKHRLSKAIAWSLAKHAPERIDEWLRAFPLRRATVQETAMDAWARKDPQAAAAYLEKDGDFLRPNSPAAKGFLKGWGETDPVEAATWAEAHHLTLPPSAIGQWAAVDPAAALEHAARAETLANRLELLGQGAASWLGEDPAAAWDWMDAHLPSAARFQAIRTYLRQLPPPDDWSRRAAAWLADYPHPHSLKDTARFLRSWNDSDAVQAWMATLPATTNQRLQKATGIQPN